MVGSTILQPVSWRDLSKTNGQLVPTFPNEAIIVGRSGSAQKARNGSQILDYYYFPFDDVNK